MATKPRGGGKGLSGRTTKKRTFLRVPLAKRRGSITMCIPPHTIERGGGAASAAPPPFLVLVNKINLYFSYEDHLDKKTRIKCKIRDNKLNIK